MPCDYSIYPSNWKTEIRPAVLLRADNRCEVCGLPNKVYINRYTREICLMNEDNAILVILTIAHLDHDETNADIKLDRLKAMCQRCHLRYDRLEKKRRKEVKKNTGQQELFKP